MKYKTLAIIAAVAVLVGCANVSKEQVGTAVGAIAGAVVGKKLGGDSGMVLGALVGGALGNRIGAHLDEQDRQKLAALEQQALATGTGGSFVTNKTKARITVEASPVTLDKRQEFVLSHTLTPHPLVAVDPVTVTAYVDTPIYNTINEKTQPKLVIQKGVPMRVTANVVNESWAVVGDGNLGLGYVPRRFLDSSIVAQLKAESVKTAAAKPAPVKTAAKKPAPGTQVAKAPDVPHTVSKDQYEQEMGVLYAAYKPRVSGQATPVSTTAAATQPAIQVVQASTECKVVSRKVEAGGQAAFVENVKYCKEPPKGWQTQTV